jgi:hypothetical protein
MDRRSFFKTLVTGLAFLMVLLFLCPLMRAQSFYGAIVGTVTDTNGAVVSNATVTATNLGTNEKHTVSTNSAGEYRIVSLVPAQYKVEVSAPNFKRFVQGNVTVQVDNTSTLNAQMDVGATSETITVTSEAPLLETESGSVGSQVEGQVVQAMPLNGRNAMNLLALVPGVVPQSSTQGAAANNAVIHTYVNGWGNYSIGGGIANESANFLDGAPNNMLGGNTPGLILTQDMVQEFKVESGAVSAEFGRFGGGVVNMTSKSGANGFHGSLYEYVRNTILNTNDYISNNEGKPKSPWHQNQYGAVFGGPIKRDKAFFMFSWENYSLHKASGNALTVPTQAMRGEDSNFPGGAVVNHPIFDHSSKACPVANYGDANAPSFLAPGQGFIPESCIDATAKVMKGFYAYPNQAPDSQGHNYFDQPLTGDDSYQYNGRVDYNLGSKQRIFGRYTIWHLQDIGQDDFKGHPGNSISSDYGATGNQTNNIVLGDTITINPNTIADVRASYMRDHFWNYGSAFGKFDLAGLGGGYTGLASQVSRNQTPIFLAPGPDGLSGPWNIPVGASQVDLYETFALSESLTKIVGKHTFKLGGESAYRNHSGIGNYAWDAGLAAFLPFINGDEWASFMLGEFLSDTIHTDHNSFSLDWSHAAYFTDTWRTTSKLTLNLGVRWEYPGGIYEKRDRATVFLPNVVDPTSGSGMAGSLPTVIPGTLALTNSPLYHSRDMSPVKWNLFGPRVSFAYMLNNSMVVRGGYGLSYVPPDMPIGLMAFNSPVNGADTTCGNAPPHPTSFWNDPFICVGGTIIQPLGRTDPNPGHVFYNQVISSPVPTDKFPYMQQWNMTLSKQWKGEILTEVSYAGSKGTKLPSSGVGTGTGGSYTSVNQLSPQYYGMGYAALSATAPCSALGGATVTVGKCLSPFPQYQGVFDTGNNTGGQSYNALYLVFSKRFGSAGVINANFTYSRTEGDTDQPGFGNGGSVQNFYNMKAEKAIASFDVPGRTIINYVLDLPFGKGKHWLNDGGAVNAIVGGWQVNGITTFQSGFPYSFSYSSPNTNLFVSGNTPANLWGAGIARPDLLPGCKLKTSGSTNDKFKNNNFFNAACIVPAGTNSPTATQNDQQLMMFGNAPRNTDAVRSQFLNNFDFAVGKSTPVWEKMNLLFRAEFFNLFNHPVFANAGSELGGVDVTGASYNQPNPTAPMVNTQRLVQLSMRLNF